jgi:hypothetical protein
MLEQWYTEWSSHVPVAVRNPRSGERFWFDTLPDDRKREAMELPVFDLTLQRMVATGLRPRVFTMHRKYERL